MKTNLVLRALNKPKTIQGIRRDFLVVILGGVLVTFNLSRSLWITLGVAFALYLVGLWVSDLDPHVVSILWRSWHYKKMYDSRFFDGGK